MISYNHKSLGYKDSGNYCISYNELKECYHIGCMETDEDFIKELPKYLHLACIICWFKEIPSDVCLCDEGIIHQLIHILHLGEEWYKDTTYITNVRKLFEEQLKLA